MGIFGGNKEDQGPSVEIHSETCTCEACMEEETPKQEETMKEEAKAEAKGFVDEAIEFVEEIPATIGEYAGKVAWFMIKPLDQIHKHTTEPFIDAFNKHFGNGS